MPSAFGTDWKGTFRDACLVLLSGRSPYTIPTFFNPAWVLLPLLPVALLSPALGSAVMFVLNIFSYIFVMSKLRTNVALMFIFLVSSGMIVNSIFGNLDGLVALGFILPPQIGLFFVLAKPQIGIAAAIFWLIESWRNGGFRLVVKVFLPVTTAVLISVLIFGPWFMYSSHVIQAEWNVSAWPNGIPVGILFLVLAVWKREIKFAIAASPFFAPYLAIHSWAIVWLGLLSIIPNHFFKDLVMSFRSSSFIKDYITKNYSVIEENLFVSQIGHDL
ncbi:MAG: hypothetical protein WCP19_03580 [Chloroflexota bacterium]